ncbi:hypothetical protein BDZ85DRAFT_281132 [Elsinoe ampelina]|uniref:Altered inheritance of mitochondria protein 9, mitochondrial n=1 Tax=Elsinoe ampelina TaxID=302913 RepID=A0A6A6GGG6_9PEZI|nr:hypothetical protein BDZ85DRAFT_281132 [Elsinoe ampelina]
MALLLHSSRMSLRSPQARVTYRSLSHSVHGNSIDLYNYTSGRWLWDEERQLMARQKWFNVKALATAAADVKGAGSCTAITKIADGDHSRVLRLLLDNEESVVVRIPYPRQPDATSSIKSEVAVMSFVEEVLGVPVPRPLLWEPTADNPVGSEYLMMEEAQGSSLYDSWHLKNIEKKTKIIDQLVSIQTALASTDFAAHGSLYFSAEAPKGSLDVPPVTTVLDSKGEMLAARYRIGPLADLDRYRARSPDRGPWCTARDWLKAIAENQISHLDAHSKWSKKPNQYNDARRDLYQKLIHLSGMSTMHQGDCLPRLWHGNNFSPHNIFITDDRVTSITGWRGSTIGPLPFLATYPYYMEHDGPHVYDLPPDYLTDERQGWRLGSAWHATMVSLIYDQKLELRSPMLHQVLHSPLYPILRRLAMFASWNSSHPGFMFGCMVELTQRWNEFSSVECPIECTWDEAERYFSDLDRWNLLTDKWEQVMEMISKDGYTSNEDYDEARKAFFGGSFYSCRVT